MNGNFMLVKVEKEGDGMKDHYQNNLHILKDGDHVKKNSGKPFQRWRTESTSL